MEGSGAVKGMSLFCREDSGTYRLTERIITIGSGPECTIRVNIYPEDTFAVQLLFTEGAYSIQQISPRIRLLVNNKKVKGSLKLSNNDVITIGDLNFEYRVASDQNTLSSSSDPLHNVINVLVSLIRNRDQDLSGLVESVCFCPVMLPGLWNMMKQLKAHNHCNISDKCSTDRFSTKAPRPGKESNPDARCRLKELQNQTDLWKPLRLFHHLYSLTGGESILGFLYLTDEG